MKPTYETREIVLNSIDGSMKTVEAQCLGDWGAYRTGASSPLDNLNYWGLCYIPAGFTVTRCSKRLVYPLLNQTQSIEHHANLWAFRKGCEQLKDTQQMMETLIALHEPPFSEFNLDLMIQGISLIFQSVNAFPGS
jgi:hypothetical protein